MFNTTALNTRDRSGYTGHLNTMCILLFDDISSRLVLLRERGTIWRRARSGIYLSGKATKKTEVPNLYSADEDETKFLDQSSVWKHCLDEKWLLAI